MNNGLADDFMRICNELPSYCFDFFVAKNTRFQAKTRNAYVLDLKVFFSYLCREGRSLSSVTMDELQQLKATDIEKFLLYIEEYEQDGKIYTNSPSGQKRKLATLRSFFGWLRKTERIQQNPTEYVDTPKIREKEIITLSSAEETRMEHIIEDGSRKSERSKLFHDKTKYRDMAIFKLFLGTGIRVSELVAIDEADVDFGEQRILITRKGGKQEYVYFSLDVLSAITDYMDFERDTLLGNSKEEYDYNVFGPLFVSLKHGRITTRRVEMIIKEYGRWIVPENVKITPHSLRKTFGTELYKETSDLYLVQQALGHESPATTAKYYAKFDEDKLKKLRER